MLKSLYEKSKMWFAVAWIIAYCVLMSAGDALSDLVGVEKSVTLPVGLLLSAALLWFLKKNGLFSRYGLCRSKASPRAMLWYLPLLCMLSANLWYGVRLTLGPGEALLTVLSMICVGFLEEVIFRGLLFCAMREENETSAVIVSSVTFGIGHLINLINGSGAELFSNLLQVVYATAAGFMFVMIYSRSQSLLVCIGAHALFNSLGILADEGSATAGRRLLFCLLLTAITASYGGYLLYQERKERNRGCEKEG